MPTVDRQNPLTFPVRIFDALTITTDPKTGEVRHEGDFVEFHRKASDPLPRTLDEAKALLRKQVGKDAALRAIVDKDRPGKSPARALAEAVREVAAHAKGAAWKAEAKVRDVKGGSVVAVEAKPVDVKPAVGDGTVSEVSKAVGDGTKAEVIPTSEESPK